MVAKRKINVPTAADATIHDRLTTAVRSMGAASKAATAAKDNRTGAYATVIAVASGLTAEEWNREAAIIDNDMMTNRDGLAVELGLKVNQKEKAKGMVRYRILPSWSVAKTAVHNAFKYKVPLTEKDKNGNTVTRSFGSVRDEVNAKAAEERNGALTGENKLRHDIAETLSQIKANVASVAPGRYDSVLAMLGKVLADLRAMPRTDTTPANAAGEAPTVANRAA